MCVVSLENDESFNYANSFLIKKSERANRS